MQLLRQFISGKDNAAKVDDPLGTTHLAVCCKVGQLTFEARFRACYIRITFIIENIAFIMNQFECESVKDFKLER